MQARRSHDVPAQLGASPGVWRLPRHAIRFAKAFRRAEHQLPPGTDLKIPSRAAALAGACIAALPSMITDQAVRDGPLVELQTDVGLPAGEVCAVYTSWRFQAMKVRAFLDLPVQSLPVAGGRLVEPVEARLLTSRLYTR